MGPPTTKRPVGLMWNLVPLWTRPFGRTGLMITSMTASRSVFWLTSGACCVESTTASIATGLPSSYSTVTWLLASGRSHFSLPFLRSSACFFTSRWARVIGTGISSSVSLQA